MSLQLYIDKLSNLRAARSSGRARPHKVCMMLAVADLIESGHISTNEILYDNVLKSRFTFYFDQLKQGNDANSPFLPFHHLETEQYWHLAFRTSSDETNYRTKSASAGRIEKYVSYAYLDIQLFEYLRAQNSAIHLRAALSTNIDQLEEQFSRWMQLQGKSEKTIKNYTGAMKSSLSNWASDAHITDKNLISVASYFEYKTIATKLRELNEFKVSDKRGKGMYSAALNAYSSFLEDITQIEAQYDIEEILAQPDISNTTKATLVNTRLGQGGFRQELINMWGGCSITNYQNTDFLIASHIKPWKEASNSERLDKYNGLLLVANLDKAFDRGYISFRDTGKIIISERLTEPNVLGINSKMQVSLQRYHQGYLAFHREEVFRYSA